LCQETSKHCLSSNIEERYCGDASRRSIVLYVRSGADAAVLFASGFFIPLPVSYCSHEFSFVFRDRFQQFLILCGIFSVISTVTCYSFMLLTHSQICALGGYYAASSDNDKELYHYSLSNNPEERSSQLLRGESLKSYIVNPS
jgi:hypothetical protein